MKLTIEVMELLSKYYFDDDQLTEIDLNELKRKHPAFQKRNMDEKINVRKANDTKIRRGILNEEYQYITLPKDDKKRYVYYPDNEVNEYFDFSDKKFNPKGNPETHEIEIPDFVLIFDRPFAYNYYYMVFLMLDKQKNQIKKKQILSKKKAFIPDYINEKRELIFDEDCNLPLVISYCICDVLDFMNNEIGIYHCEGTLCLYAAKKSDEELLCRGYGLSKEDRDRLKGINWFEPVYKIYILL